MKKTAFRVAFAISLLGLFFSVVGLGFAAYPSVPGGGEWRQRQNTGARQE